MEKEQTSPSEKIHEEIVIREKSDFDRYEATTHEFREMITIRI